MSKVGLKHPSLASLCAWRTVSTVCSGGLLLKHHPSPHWVPSQLSSRPASAYLIRLGMHCEATSVRSKRSRHPSAPTYHPHKTYCVHLRDALITACHVRFPVSNTDAEFAQRHSRQIHYIKHLADDRSVRTLLSAACRLCH